MKSIIFSRSLVTMCMVLSVACAAKQVPRQAPLAVNPTTFAADELREVSNLIIVTDASGSLYSNATLAEARSLSASLVKSLPDTNARARTSRYEVGALAFGGDIRTKAPLAPFDRAKLLSTVEGIEPIGTKAGTGGTTPFRHVFDELAADLNGRSGEAAIVIFSDGEADQPEYALTRARALAESYTGGQLCIHGVQVGNSPAGEGFLRAVSGVTSCGSVRNASGVSSPAPFSQFAKAVVVGSAPAPAVAAAPAPVGACSGTIRLRGIEFGFDKANINAGSAAVLDAAIDALKTCPDVVLNINGHTDGVGTAVYNQGLSERRAGAVREYLSNNGIPAGRLTAKGYGLSNPVASNDTREGRAKNRRVDLSPK